MKQIYQELIVPVPLAFTEYGDPYSVKKPSGSMLSAYALFELTDPISTFTRKYSPTSASFSKSYETLLNSIDDYADKDATNVVASAIKKLDIDAFTRLGPGAEKFYLVETYPYNWLNKKDIDVNFTVGPIDSESDFVEIGSSAVKNVQFTGFSITITRQWYDARVFTTHGWSLNGYCIGEVSSGDYEHGGLIPFIPTQLMIATSGENKMLIGVVSDIIPQTPSQIAPKESFSANRMLTRARSMASAPVTSKRTSILVDKFGRSLL